MLLAVMSLLFYSPGIALAQWVFLIDLQQSDTLRKGLITVLALCIQYYSNMKALTSSLLHCLRRLCTDLAKAEISNPCANDSVIIAPKRPTIHANEENAHLRESHVLQLVAVYGSWHLGQLQVGLSRAIRLTQCSSVRITTHKSLPMQMDGEPWQQQPATLQVAFSIWQECQLSEAVWLNKAAAHRKKRKSFWVCCTF